MEKLDDLEKDGSALAQQASPPEGYLPLFRSSPFLDLIGPLFYRPEGGSFTVAMRVLAQHTNSSRTMHGGLFATLADISLGYVTATSREPKLRMSTASLTVDYLGVASLGSWVESRVTINKVGRSLAFANAVITADGRAVATARALFSIVDTAQASSGSPEQPKE